jgi:hypothetical protein
VKVVCCSGHWQRIIIEHMRSANGTNLKDFFMAAHDFRTIDCTKTTLSYKRLHDNYEKNN